MQALACDASVVGIVENENGDPLNVGRKTRSISAPLRRALNARDKGCRFPGCINKRFIDGHHVHHWANGGETKSADLEERKGKDVPARTRPRYSAFAQNRA